MLSTNFTHTSAYRCSLVLPFHGGNTMPAQVRAAVTTQSRRSANYQPNAWSYEYLESLKNDHLVETYKYKATKLEAEVKHMIMAKYSKIMTTLSLIDEVEKLGLGYRFDTEIRIALDRFVSLGGLNASSEIQNSLNATALSFRLLRHHGYNVSAEVFEKFKNEDGNFKECLKEDINAMLSLYEATYLGFPGETLLDEANLFAKSHLMEIKVNLGKELAEQIDRKLELPIHHRAQRIDAEWNIRAYSKTKDANKVLLELAVMDFNMVQSFLLKDLQDVSRWWRSVGLASKLSFARDRMMECFFWAVGMVFQPQYSNCRKALAKLAALITVIDDVYDVYGTMDELELLTDAIQRWDVNAINHLPDYLKVCFFALYNTVNEIAYEILKEKGESVLPHLTKAWGDMCKSFLQEAKWNKNKYTPTYEEYVENGWISSSGTLLLVFANFFLNDNTTKYQQIDNITKYHHLLRWPSLIFRLGNDLASASGDLEKAETAKSTLCYMKDNSISEERAKEIIRDSIDEIWKKMNKERIDNTYFSKAFIDTTFNLARIVHQIYQYGDAHSAPDETSAKCISSVLIEPISLDA